MADGEPDWLLGGGDDVADIAHRYDDWAATYDDELEAWSYRAPEIAAALAIGHGRGLAPVLDAGCGTGRVGRALRRLGYGSELIGADASPASLDVARGQGVYDALGPVDLQAALPWEDDRFGAITCVGVMTYVPDVEACWREFARIGRRDAVVVATQRDDLFDERDTGGAIDRIVADGLWDVIDVSDPQPYLPGNADFGTEIGVRYVVARVR